MKLLVVGTDKNIFTAGSEARRRVAAYGGLFEELHIIVFTPCGFSPVKIGANAWLYPTNSHFWFLAPAGAVGIGLAVIRARGIDAISVQDPAESGLSGWLLKKKTQDYGDSYK